MLKRFIIPFDNGICVIKHWLNNYIQKDVTLNKKELIAIKDNVYTLKKDWIQIVYKMCPSWIPRLD